MVYGQLFWALVLFKVHSMDFTPGDHLAQKKASLKTVLRP